jgi:tyrosyl-tRNA synthetase
MGSEAEMKAIIAERPLNIYWGTAPTGRIHIGYLYQMLKVADYLKARCNVTILIADLHAYLDSMKSSLDLIKLRSDYYEKMIQTILITMGVDISRLSFIRGTSFQLSENYTMDVYKLHSSISIRDAQHAGAEVVKQSDNPIVNGLLYPGLQSLDIEYLKMDVFSGGVDQRKINVFGRTVLPKLKYKKRAYFMTGMISGLRFAKKEVVDVDKTVLDREQVKKLVKMEVSDDCVVKMMQQTIDDYKRSKEGNRVQQDKMSSSNNDSKIDLLDTRNQIRNKINKCYCDIGDVSDNCLLEILDKLIFPMFEHKEVDFVINRPDKYGGALVYKDYDSVKSDFAEQTLHPSDLKLGVIDAFESLIKPIRDVFNESAELVKLVKTAYP